LPVVCLASADQYYMYIHYYRCFHEATFQQNILLVEKGVLDWRYEWTFRLPQEMW